MSSDDAANSINVAMILLGATLVLSQGWLQRFRGWLQGKVAVAGAAPASGNQSPTYQQPGALASQPLGTSGGILSPATQAAFGQLAADLGQGASTPSTGTVLT